MRLCQHVPSIRIDVKLVSLSPEQAGKEIRGQEQSNEGVLRPQTMNYD